MVKFFFLDFQSSCFFTHVEVILVHNNNVKGGFMFKFLHDNLWKACIWASKHRCPDEVISECMCSSNSLRA